MGITAAIAAVVGAGAAVAGGVEAKKSSKAARAEADRERGEQEKLSAEASREQARTAEIVGAEKKRSEAKNKARKVRSIGGGGLLTGGETGLMGKTKLGE